MSSTALIQPTVIITGHAAADYDALAAMVAAQKLYPGATLVAPTLLPRQRTHPFYEGLAATFGFVQPKDCDFSQVRLVVVVDSHNQERFEHIADVLQQPELEIHAYDHHPDTDSDLPLAQRHIRITGSTTTIITSLLKEQDIPLTVDEATLLGLGVYEDTGSFTYSNTTEEDYLAAAYLLHFGMNLVTIAELNSPDLTREHIHIFDNLFRGAVTHNIQGVEVTISEITLDYYVNDFAEIVKSFMEMAQFNAIIVLATMGDKIHMIGRSELADVDVGVICTAFGGGGHPKAASATIKNQTVTEVRAELLTLLVAFITPQIMVERHMSAPAKTVDDSTPIAMAEHVMSRYGLKAMPVVAEGTRRCVGIIDQHTASRAVAHKLGKLPTGEYMQRNIRTLRPGETLHLAIEIILKQRQRLVPIVEDEDIIGVITRTDVVKLLIDKTLHIPEGVPHDQSLRERNIAPQLNDHIPKGLFQLLQQAGKLGDTMGMGVFVVGGFVRDLLMKQPNLDVDISVEGDGPAFAQALAELLGGTVRVHDKFKTAIVTYTTEMGLKQHLDVATARLEFYEQPAALPTVELSSIQMDLYRRDFTINALAIQLNEKRFGILIDPFGAQKDLREKNLSVLHSLSLVEDPTRILRAIRFERRFSFRISSQTERLIKNALSLDLLEKLSGPRLFNEFVHVCDEYDVPSCLRRMDQWNILAGIHPILKLNPAKDVLIASIEEAIGWYKLLYKHEESRNWVVYLLGLCQNAKYPDVKELLNRLGFIEPMAKEFSTVREKTRRAVGIITTEKKAHEENSPEGDTDMPMSVIYRLLSPIGTEGLLFLLARHGQEHQIGQYVSLYFTRLREMKISISGQDLVRLGYKPGVLFGQTLQYVHGAMLDGKAPTKAEQLHLANAYLVRQTEGDENARRNFTEVLGGRL